jgi:transposase
LDEAGRLVLPSNFPIDGHSFRRVEVLTGTPRRRHWSAAEKAAIVAQSFAPGAVTSTIALRYGLHRNQLYSWRRELRAAAVADGGIALPDFVRSLPNAGQIPASRRSRSRSARRWCGLAPASTSPSSARSSAS